MQTSIEISNDLYGALDRNELVVYYQPQIDLLTGEITGVEALLRWLHPTRGIIPPGVFIPIAEKNSLIYGIGEWVLRQSCIQNKEWQDMGLPKINMSVNLSSLQIINPTIVENIQMIIEETGLEPKYVELEITEGISISNTDHVLNFLNKLKSTGVSIAIDDFGTEYSSLSRLKWLPVDRIKIDMQFVQGIETDEKDRAIIEVIINLAKSLGLNVLAEGVETKEQLEFLKQKKCDHVQGYYYYKPMPANEIEKILLDLSRISLLKFHK
jgi:EAL domain-containing protein (putative c-di-GMP-specific phosphodiesterase class I)